MNLFILTPASNGNHEQQLKGALNEFTGGPDGWRLNPGDGAFYGPKIDIKVRR